MTTVNNYKSSTIRGLLKNSDYPDGSQLANAIFDRSVTIGSNLNVNSSITANSTIKARSAIEVSFNNAGAEQTIIELKNNGNIDCKTITLSGVDFINSTNMTVNTNLILNNNFISYAVDPASLVVENLFYGDIFSNKGVSSINGFFVKSNSGLNATTYALIDNTGQAEFINLLVNDSATISNNLTTGKLFLNDNFISYAVDPASLVVENLFYGDIFSNKGVSSINGFFVKSDSGLNATTYALIDNTGNAELINLLVNDSATISNNLTVSNDATISENLTVNNNLTVSNDATISNNLTVNNVIKPSTTIAPNSSVHLGFIHTISKVSIISTVTTTLTILQNINVNNTTFSYGTYRFKLFFSGSGSTSQTLTFCINTAPSLYVNKNGRRTTNTNISTLQYDITLNIYTATTVYFLAQTNIGTYTINDAFIEMVRIA